MTPSLKPTHLGLCCRPLGSQHTKPTSTPFVTSLGHPKQVTILKSIQDTVTQENRMDPLPLRCMPLASIVQNGTGPLPSTSMGKRRTHPGTRHLPQRLYRNVGHWPIAQPGRRRKATKASPQRRIQQGMYGIPVFTLSGVLQNQLCSSHGR